MDDEELRRVIFEVLQEADATARENGLAVNQMLQRVGNKITENILPYRIYNAARTASQDPSSPIQSGGPWRGYYLDEAAVVQFPVDLQDEPQEEVRVGDETLSEKDLYPLVAKWLLLRADHKVSYDIANGTRGGEWGNPDLVALGIHEDLGLFDVEVTTVEVKPSSSNWRKTIFQAVSHKRFSDRSYFIFRSEKADPIETEMLAYAEKFGVGVAYIVLPEDRIRSLKDWNNLGEREKIEFTESIVDRVPASLDPVSVQLKIQFLKQIGINNRHELYQFGQG